MMLFKKRSKAEKEMVAKMKLYNKRLKELDHNIINTEYATIYAKTATDDIQIEIYGLVDPTYRMVSVPKDLFIELMNKVNTTSLDEYLRYTKEIESFSTPNK